MEKRERQNHILEMLARNRVEDQEQLLALLAAEGVVTAQSTLSRDLRELGVVKGADGYEPPGRRASGATVLLSRLAAEFASRVRAVDAGGSIVVVRTGSSVEACELGKRLDGLGLPRIVAAVASGSTVMVITRSAADAREISRQWRIGARMR